MIKIVYKLLFFLLLIFIDIKYAYSIEDYAGEITSLIKPENKIINMGPCLIHDSLRADFILKNIGLKGLYMKQLVPSFFLGATPDDPDKFNNFKRITDLPKTFPPNSSDTLVIQFFSDLVPTPPGWHNALLGLAFLKEETKEPPVIAKIDTFYLKVKKTTKFFDGFDDFINFDSVYINPTNPKKNEWRGRNVFSDSIKIINREFKYITQPNTSENEFIFNENIDSFTVYHDGIVKWNSSYKPIDKGLDSILMIVNFIPKPYTKPDSVDSVSVMILGTGVEQKLELTSNMINFSGDTILLGNIKSGDTQNIFFPLKNSGNIPVNVIKEELIDVLSGEEAKNFNLFMPFTFAQGSLLPDSLRFIMIKFNPETNGSFLIKYVLSTDLLERNIYGVSENQKYCNFYIKGKVVSPKLTVSKNVIDFGNVIINKSDCPSIRDTVIRILNTGNEKLIVSNIVVKPDFNFTVSANSFELEPNQDTIIHITFYGIQNMLGNYRAELRIVNNQKIPADTTYIQLKATGVLPVSGNLFISDIVKAKPGTKVEIPIILKNDLNKPSIYAGKFSAELSYNKTILKYLGVKTLNTASEGAANLGDNFEIEGKSYINIDLEMPSGTYFKASDTIALLRFDTFLGDAVSSELAFSNPKFGDKNCDEVFGLNIINGVFTTDSVCGIEYKAVPKPNSKYYINVYQEKFGDNQIKFEITIPVKMENTIELYDVFGNKILNILESELPAGVYSSYLNTQNLNSGIYYLLLRNKFYQSMKPVVIIK